MKRRPFRVSRIRSARANGTRARALGGVDPRTLPAGTVYPCNDPRVGTRAAGERHAGTILGCATPPENARGAHYAVGSVVSSGELSRSAKARERTRTALRARYEGEDFDARPARRGRPTTRTSRALALRAPDPEVYHGEVVDLAPRALDGPAWSPDLHGPVPTWGGRRIPIAREAPVDRLFIFGDPRVPNALPTLARIYPADTRTGAMRESAPRGASLGEVGPRVVIAPTALEAAYRAFVRQPVYTSSYIGSQLQQLFAAALARELAHEIPTPGTHAPVVVNHQRLAVPFGRALRFDLVAGPRARPVTMLARAARFGDGEFGVLIEVPRVADAPLPQWFPGMPAQALPERDLTAAQRAVLGKARASFPWLPLRAELHPDGRMRTVFVAVAAPRGHSLSGDKPTAPGTVSLRGGYYSTSGTYYRGDTENEPHWREVADLRFAPSPAAAQMPTLVQTSEEAVDAGGYKARNKVIAALREHFDDVADALRTGRPVAPEVVAEYPSLAAFYAASMTTGRSRAEVLAEEVAAQRAQDWAEDPDITVHWSVENGLLLYTRGKDAKIIAAIRGVRGVGAHFKWSRTLGAWFRPQSVGVSESTANIDAIAKQLRQAGMVVRVERGETTSLGEANERRQEHKFMRADRYADRAGDALVRAGDTEARADAIRAEVPVGAATRRAERMEARADRLDAKAEGDLEYVQHAASVAQNLARTAASYDVTAELTRKQAERRADEFARLFVAKVKGRVGAEKLYSDKTDNLSEYRLTWDVSYPPATKLAARVVYDGRTITVHATEDVVAAANHRGAFARYDLRDFLRGTPIVLRQDVSTRSAEEVFELVVAALPKSSFDAAQAVPTSPRAFERELSKYGKRRVGTLASALAPREGYVLQIHPAGDPYGNGWRNLSIEETRPGSGFPSGLGASLAHVEGMTFRVLGHRPQPGSERLEYWNRKTDLVGELAVDFTGMTIAAAWEHFVAAVKAIFAGKPIAQFLPKTTMRARRDGALDAASRRPVVRAGTGAVERLARDTTDAAARARVAEVDTRVGRVAEDAADRLAARSGEPRETHAALVASARAAGTQLGFFPTPPTLAEYAVSLAAIRPGDRVLEPSAGMGGLLAPLVDAGARVTAVEFQADRAAYLAAAWAPKGVDVRVGDFLAVAPTGDFDAVVMNPPFSVEGAQYTDIDHVLHAMPFLRPGGRLVAIMSAATPTRSLRKSADFREAIRASAPRWETVDAGRFRISGTDVPVVLLTLTRPSR